MICQVEKVLRIDDNSCEVHRVSMLGDRVNVVTIDASKERVTAWFIGSDMRHIQEAFSDLNADQREFLLSGMMPEEWEEMFGEGEEGH